MSRRQAIFQLALSTAISFGIAVSVTQADRAFASAAAHKKTHKPVYSEDDPRFMEGFQPEPQPSAPPNPYLQRSYYDWPPYYVAPPGYRYDYGYGRPPKPVLTPFYP